MFIFYLGTGTVRILLLHWVVAVASHLYLFLFLRNAITRISYVRSHSGGKKADFTVLNFDNNVNSQSLHLNAKTHFQSETAYSHSSKAVFGPSACFRCPAHWSGMWSDHTTVGFLRLNIFFCKCHYPLTECCLTRSWCSILSWSTVFWRWVAAEGVQVSAIGPHASAEGTPTLWRSAGSHRQLRACPQVSTTWSDCSSW